MTDYRDELLNKILFSLYDSGIKDASNLKPLLIRVISGYEVRERCTELATIDDSNARFAQLFIGAKRVEGGSTSTAQNRFYIIKRFSNDIGKSFRDVSSFDILCWLADKQQSVSLSTTESYRTVLASMFSWLSTNGLIPSNPMANIKPIKHPESLKKSFTSVEVDALKTACKSKADRAMVELLLSSGLRCEEMCNLRWNDINFVTKDINVIEGKGNKNRVTMMDDVARKYILDYRESLNFKSDYVFAVKYRGEVKARTTDSVWRRLKVIADKAGVSDVSPHKFRHTFATTLYKRGLDIRMIQKLLGHSNINTTTIYIDSDIDTLRDAYKKCV